MLTGFGGFARPGRSPSAVSPFVSESPLALILATRAFVDGGMLCRKPGLPNFQLAAAGVGVAIGSLMVQNAHHRHTGSEIAGALTCMRRTRHTRTHPLALQWWRRVWQAQQLQAPLSRPAGMLALLTRPSARYGRWRHERPCRVGYVGVRHQSSAGGMPS